MLFQLRGTLSRRLRHHLTLTAPWHPVSGPFLGFGVLALLMQVNGLMSSGFTGKNEVARKQAIVHHAVAHLGQPTDGPNVLAPKAACVRGEGLAALRSEAVRRRGLVLQPQLVPSRPPAAAQRFVASWPATCPATCFLHPFSARLLVSASVARHHNPRRHQHFQVLGAGPGAVGVCHLLRIVVLGYHLRHLYVVGSYHCRCVSRRPLPSAAIAPQTN